MANSAEPDKATLDFYASEAPVYAASGQGGASRHLQGFLASLPAGAKILELGCGGGRDSAEMLRLGFDIVPTDGVQEMAGKAQARIGIPVRVLRFDALDDVEAFDAVWAHASLLHVPRASLQEVLSRVHRALKPGGRHFATYKSGGTEGRDGFGRYFNYLSEQQATDAYRNAGVWQSVEVRGYTGGGYDGRSGPWIAVSAVR